MLERREIEALIPHSGAMVLLDRVVSVDDRAILCETMSHRREDNPLRTAGRLPAISGAEYGAQAAAIHGPALSGVAADGGQVVLLRDVVWQVADLARFADPLFVRAECLLRDGRNLAYRFTITVRDHAIMTGECGIILS